VDWANAQTQIVTALREAAGDPTLDVRWDETAEATGWRSDRLVRVSVISVRGDSHETRYVEGPSDLTPRIYGPRVLVLQIFVETQRQTLAHTSEALALRLRTGIRLPAALAALEAAGLGLARVGPVRSVSFPDLATGRRRSAAVFEIEHNAHGSVAGAAIAWVASVAAEGEIDAREIDVLVETPGAPVPAP
jgi:hypothetical protein